MLRLKKYLKPYIWVCIVSISFLVLQVATELNLPNYLSKIVDEGLQRGGIVSNVPEAISEDGYAFLQMFMSQDDKEIVADTFTKQTLLSKTEYLEKVREKFPVLASTEGYILNENVSESQMQTLENIFGRSMYAFVDLSKQLGGHGSNGENAVDTSGGASFDVQKLYAINEYAAMLPKQSVDTAIKAAQDADQTALSQTSAAFIKGFYTELGADTGEIQMNSIYKNGLIMLAISLGNVLAAVMVGFFSSRVGSAVARDLRKAVFEKVTSFSNSEFDKYSTASLITRTTNDITQVQQVVTMSLRMLCFAPMMGIGAIIMALSKSTSMSWIIALAVIVLICTIVTISIIVLPRFKKMQKLIDRLNLVTRENLSGMLVIRAFDNQKFEEKRFDTVNKELTDNNLFANRIMMSLMPFMMLIMNATMLMIIWAGAHQIAQSTLEIGAMMAFMQYAMEVIMSFLMISMIFIMLPRASVSGERIADVLETPVTIQDAKNPKNFAGGKPNGTIEFRNVSFSYENADECVIKNISFTANPGETTAFIGSTGSGKSTLINLVPRFYDVTEGTITIDGIDIRDIPQATLRQNIGYVPQKGILFSGDIASNLRYGDETANADALLEACEIAQAMEFIASKPDGISTEISQGGTNVSGGQRQRLSIARALVKKAQIYIFDDSFSALDFKTDAALRRALAEKTKKSTVLLVAQRISTIMNAEKIIVLSDGEIAGIGTHKQLLKECETYAEIALSQLSKEELDNE